MEHVCPRLKVSLEFWCILTMIGTGYTGYQCSSMQRPNIPGKHGLALSPKTCFQIMPEPGAFWNSVRAVDQPEPPMDEVHQAHVSMYGNHILPAQANESSSVLQIPGSARAIQGPKRSRALLPREKNQDAPFKSVCPAIINGDRLTQHCRKTKRRCTSGSNLSYRSQPIHKVHSNPPSHRKRWAGPNLNL